MRSFEKVLIANRGEIAVRIALACREMRLRSVAVYSEADRKALHVQSADEAHFIGPAPASESYLSIENILRAARHSHAEAVHPGYGFLSENADFAQAVLDAGLVFIGPSPLAIRAMGDKAKARALMLSGGIPVVPGYQGPSDDDSLRRAVDALGYPVLVKAAAGGGGKAMRVVNSAVDLIELAGAARREAQHAFADARLILEKYIPRARHVEFQVLGDRNGNIVHLLERECSIQRRHQKVIEETPSPLLDSGLRARMGNAAVEAAHAVGYENAGTVEFMVDLDERSFYFLEMNTRLQVEHPITEVTTGIDLVRHQLLLAAGEPLGFDQSEIKSRGHALECRIYAEDPANGFLPATGHLLQVIDPRGPGVRVDSGITAGDEVTVHYDPLLSKVIAVAESREAAIRRMQAALGDYVVLGVTSNIEFLQAVLAHPEFQAGVAGTTFVEETFRDWRPDNNVSPEVLVATAIAEMSTPTDGRATAAAVESGDPFSPWERGWFPGR